MIRVCYNLRKNIIELFFAVPTKCWFFLVIDWKREIKKSLLNCWTSLGVACIKEIPLLVFTALTQKGFLKYSDWKYKSKKKLLVLAMIFYKDLVITQNMKLRVLIWCAYDLISYT